MRSHYALAAILTFALAGTATAQTTPSTATAQPTSVGESVNHWVASGFVGGGFSAKGDSPTIDSSSAESVAFGGQIAWLWKGIVGPEFLASWAPNFGVSSAFIDGDTRAANYMINAMGAIPLGADGLIQPYVSGGYGRMRLSADFVNDNDSRQSHGQWGGNIGGGIMAFASTKWGVRGDVRYFRGRTEDSFSGSTSDVFFQSVASGLSYWNATGGVSYRW